MRLVIDTNVIVSAALRGGVPLKVMGIITRRPEMVWVVSAAVMHEYLQVLSRPTLRLSGFSHAEVLDLVTQSPKELVHNLEVSFPQDPGDSKVLGAAVAGQADFLVTGDRALLHLASIGMSRIVTPTQWCELIS